MNKKKILIPVILIAVLAIAAAVVLIVLRSCDNTETKTGSVSTVDTSWVSTETETVRPGEMFEAISMISAGKETTSEDLALLKSKGLTCTMILSPDGTGVLNLFGDETNLVWNEKTISTDKKTMSYIRKDDQLTLIDGDSTLTFEKTGDGSLSF